MQPSDTIVAIATPAGVGGIAVVRLSGPDALSIALAHLSVSALPPRRAVYCRFLQSADPAERESYLDDGIAIYYPCGYTGEPTVELSCHGSRYVQQALVQALVDSGARLAEPGEYTLRAFLHGRLNLSQAEAVADLIDAVTPAQHRLAVSQLRGGYADRLRLLRQQLLDLTSLLELELDFSQEDVEFADRHELRRLLATLDRQLATLIDSFAAGNALKQGVPVAIVGAPNAGKSSLLNALLGDDRAIVSDVPGTTRDTIEELLTLDGITFRFIDTAGLRRTADAVEAQGVERSLRALRQARLVLYVHDASTPWREPQLDLQGQQLIVVLNKSDLALPDGPAGALAVSARTGDGLDRLRDAMLEAVRRALPQGDEVLLSNVRHRDALLRVQEALRQADDGLQGGMPADLVAVDLRDALYHLGTITGEVATDDVLGNIFSRFCIGK